MLNKRTYFQLIFLIFLIFDFLNLKAQTPQAFPYQSVLRDAAGNLIANQNVSLKFSILSGGATGTLVYQETQNAMTNNLGLFDVNIGQGTVTSGTFSSINWGNGSKYLRIELDVNGGNNFVVMDNSQLLSVPYALHANTSNSTNNAHYIGESYGGGIVFYVYDNGQHGLIAATDDQSAVAEFMASTNSGHPIILSHTSANGVNAGMKNTLFLLGQSTYIGSTYDYPTKFNFAPYIAYNYFVTINGVTYGDWYLPSLYELQLLYDQKNLVGGFNFTNGSITTCNTSNAYLCSTSPIPTSVNNPVQFYMIFFGNGYVANTGNSCSQTCRVRAIRHF